MKKAYFIRLTIAGIVLLVAILAIIGFYPVNFLNLELTPLIQRVIVDFSLIALVLILAISLITLLFGRFYCSLLCPFGILQEFMAIILRKKGAEQKNHPYKYYIATVTFGVLIGGSAIAIRYIDPYTLFGSAVSFSILGIIAVLLVLAIVFFKNRFFCTNICPVGAILGLISKFSINKIYIDGKNCVSCGLCAKNCPAGCINYKEKAIDNETCVKCLKCFSVCKKNAIQFGTKPVKFSPKRRELIIATTALMIFGGAIKTGIEISKTLAKKVHGIILPPGAANTNRMANNCLNCNLCIENCPNKILAKADEDFCTVHIDFSKGKGFCKYDCNKCSNVCPSGAIKKITIDEKQNTRIAMAQFKKEICTRCGLCSKSCPKGSITTDEKGEPYLDAAKCIGCAKCKSVCPVGAIEIFAVNEQKII